MNRVKAVSIDYVVPDQRDSKIEWTMINSLYVQLRLRAYYTSSECWKLLPVGKTFLFMKA